MVPVKSLTMIYGIKPGYCKTTNQEHDCEKCSNIKCSYRVNGKEYEVMVLKDVSKVYLAGGFGNYLHLDSAFAIKLLPQGLNGKVKAIGNGAGTGAKLALLYKEAFATIQGVADKIEYIELSTSMEFQDKFIKAIRF